MKIPAVIANSLPDWLSQHAAVARLLGESLKLPEAVDAALVPSLDLLVRLRVDTETLAATLAYELHLPSERLPASLHALIDGQREAERVWALYAEKGQTVAPEGLRRLLLAIIRDLRVVFILLARQLVRLRTAASLDEHEQRALAQLTADIHAPLANRLGIWQLKWELEDLSFRFLNPDAYKRIAKALDERRGDREDFIERVKRELTATLKLEGIDVDVAGRPKHIYSIWRKMSRKAVDLDGLYDIRAVRLLVKDVGQCYAALGIVHALWPPVPGEFDDYIARPKGNNYRSLHTAVVGPEGKTLEIQIRTPEMHEHAELGVAAHWRYKEGGGGDAAFERKIAGLRNMLEAKADTESDAALLAGLQTEVVEDRVYLLTPQGKVVDLPKGATVLDFAYSVHTEVGHKCRGAKLNGRLVPLDHQPVSGETIEIVTGKVAEPKRDWLVASRGFLITPRAKEKVRSWFKKLDHDRNVAAGRELLDKELKRLAWHDVDLTPLPARFNLKTQDDLLVAMGVGDVTAGHVARALHEIAQPKTEKPELSADPVRARRREKDAITIEGVGNLLTTMARCCQPVPGDPIIGWLTKGRGVSVHRNGCASFNNLVAKDPARVIHVDWGGSSGQYEVDVLVRAYDRKGLLKDVSSAISAADAHVLAASTRLDRDHGTVEMYFAVRVSDYGQLSSLLHKVSSLPNVIEARRNTANRK